jgi:hypothetical protein
MEQWLNDPAKVGAYALLLGMVIAFFTGKLVPGPTHDRIVKERDRYLEVMTRQGELLGRASTAGVEVVKAVQAAPSLTVTDIAAVVRAELARKDDAKT